MVCLKCGRKAEAQQVFCSSCLETMEKHPVRPGTAVHLPSRKTQPPSKKASHKKRALSPEDQIQHLRKALRRMYLCVTVLLIVLGMATALLIHEIQIRDLPVIGQNYTIDTTRQPD